MIQTITITKNKDLRIPWKVLKKANFPVGEFRLSIKKPSIFIVPQEKKAEEKDWLDELLEDPIARKNFDRILEETEQEYKEGKLRPIENLFKKLGV